MIAFVGSLPSLAVLWLGARSSCRTSRLTPDGWGLLLQGDSSLTVPL